MDLQSLIELPGMYIAAACSAVAVIVLGAFAFKVPPRQRYARRLPICGSCRYDLAGLAAGSPCPECGGTTLAVARAREHAAWVAVSCLAPLALAPMLLPTGQDAITIAMFTVFGSPALAVLSAMNLALWHAGARTRWIAWGATMLPTLAAITWVLYAAVGEDPKGFLMLPVVAGFIAALGSVLFVPALLAAIACNVWLRPRRPTFS